MGVRKNRSCLLLFEPERQSHGYPKLYSNQAQAHINLAQAQDQAHYIPTKSYASFGMVVER